MKDYTIFINLKQPYYKGASTLKALGTLGTNSIRIWDR